MIHNNLSCLSIIGIEKSGAKSLNIDNIINNFTEYHNNIEEYCKNKYYMWILLFKNVIFLAIFTNYFQN